VRFTDRSERTAACRNCDRQFPESRLDARRWCPTCRAEVIRRASIAGRITGIVGALALMTFVFATVGSAPRFVIGWLALVVAVYFFLAKLATRVAFEVIRGRGVPPAAED
jgi:hypothetical protein